MSSIAGLCAEAGNCIKIAPVGTVFALQAGGAYPTLQPNIPKEQFAPALGKWSSPADISPQYQPRSLLSLTPGITGDPNVVPENTIANVTVTIDSEAIAQKMLYYLPPNRQNPFAPIDDYILLEGTSQTTPTSATIQIALPISNDSFDWPNLFSIAYYDPKLPVSAQLPAFTFTITRADYTVNQPIQACFNTTTGKFSHVLSYSYAGPNAVATQACWNPEPPNPTPYPSKGMSTGAVIGISIGAIVFLALLIVLIVYLIGAGSR